MVLYKSRRHTSALTFEDMNLPMGRRLGRFLQTPSYVRRAVEEVERELARVGKQLKKKVVSPLASG
jgi:hypothetical protein